MPKLKNMLGETGTIEIPVPDDEPLIVCYRRGVMTPRSQIQMLEMQAKIKGGAGGEAADPDALMFMCRMFAGLIDSWNLTGEDGRVIGTDAESLADVDMGILTLVMQEIGREMSPDPLRDSGSKPGSSQAGSSGPLRIISAS